MLAVALAKDDVKGQQRRRAQDRGKALAGKSTLNRLELTAPDYDGSSRQNESGKPETKKIVVDPESIDALRVDLFLEAHERAPEQIILDVDATDDVLYGRQEKRFYHGYYRDYCYLPLYVFCGEHLLCARLRMSNIDAAADSVEEWSRWWRAFASAGPRCGFCCAATAPHDRGSFFQFFQYQRSPIGGNIAPIEAPNQLPSSQFLGRPLRLGKGGESSWSLQWRDDQGLPEFPLKVATLA